jgi:PAS domain S-box-containing protein
MLWIVVASLTVALGIYSSLLYINLKQIIIANQEEHLSSLSVAASREMALWLDGKKREMSTVADSISLAGDHRSSIGARLKRHAMNNPEYEMVFHADTDGNALTSSDFKTSIVDRAYFQQVLVTGREVVSDPVISRQSQRPIVAIAAPVKKGNVVTGVVGCTISLGYLSQLISHIKPVETGYAFVVQGDGTTIIHPDSNLVMKHNILKDPQIDPNLKDAVRKMTDRQAGLTAYVYDHVAKYLAFAPVAGSNWALAINAPVDKVLRELTPINRLIVITPVFVIALASVLISILLIVFILRPITMLRTVMSRVEGGDLDVRGDYESPDEMGQLTDSFNQMVQNIKEGRERIRQSEENYRHLFENAQEGILIAQGEQNLFVNPALVEILGYPKEMITSSPFATFIHPDDREKVVRRHLRRLAGESVPTSYEFRIVTAEGAEKWLQIKSRIIRWDGVPSSLSFVDNVTERKRAEDELRASESRFRHYFELPLIGFAITSPGKGWIEVNDKLCEILGYSREELYRLTWADLTPREDLAEEESVYDRILKGEAGSHTLEKRYIRKDGTVIQAMVSSICVRKPDGAVDHFVALVEDITDRRRAEDSLRQSESTLRSVFLAAPVGICIMKNRLYQRANAFWCESFGYPEESIIGKDTRMLYENDEEYNRVGHELYTHLRERGLAATETRLRCSDGVLRDVIVTAAPLRADDLTAGTVAIIHDVTERKRAEDELRESQRRLSEIIEFLPDATFVLDREERVIAWNRAIEAMTGIKKEDMLGKGNYEYALPFYGDRRPSLIDLALHPDKEEEKQYTVIQRVGDILVGESFTPNLPPGDIHLSSTASVLRDSKGEIIAAIECIRDNTERKRMEERLNRAEKMEGLGRLAGGVAHDLNNVLGVLVGYSELLAEKLSEDNTLRRYAVNIQQSGLRGAAIIQDLLTLARRGVTVSEVVDLNRVIFDYLRTPEFEALKSHHPNVKVWTELEEGILNIKGSPVHLSKTIMNLVSNATEAISDQGDVTIRSENRYLDQPIRGYDDMQEGDYVVLTVSDSGMGISSQDIGKIFEPFYTKKVMGRSGTGLGLAVVWGTVKDHNGYIDVHSEEGKGTTFTLYFPVTRDELTKTKEASPQSMYMGRGESILVVDDVKEQRELAVNMLGRLGYQVEALSSGEEAIAYLDNNKADLVVLDMVMDPGIDGLETYRRILQINPEQKAVIVSGFSETDRVKEAQEVGVGSFVRKPYILEKIGIAVRKELDRK